MRSACEGLRLANYEVTVQKFELIQSDERFHAIADAWQALWKKSGASVFQSHPWISQCFQYLSRNNVHHHIGVMWDDDGCLAAVLPLSIRRSQGLKVLEWSAQDFNDYCDGFGDSAALRACWAALHGLRQYDILRLKFVRPDAAVAPLLQAGWTRDAEGTKCLQLKSEWPSGDAWLKAHYPKARNNYSRGLRKLQEMGQVEVNFYTTPPDGVVERLRVLKLEWTYANGGPVPLFEEKDLFGGLVNALASLDRLLMAVVTCDGEIVASSINATQGDTLQSYFTVYDPKYERASPGIVLLVEVTRWAFDNGFAVHDHLRGTESYKLPFSNSWVVLRGYTGAATARGHAALTLRRLGSLLVRAAGSWRQRLAGTRRPAEQEVVPA
jgi:CelD/BcsL family acetyltransferase involved in cellulose biosynthesis